MWSLKDNLLEKVNNVNKMCNDYNPYETVCNSIIESKPLTQTDINICVLDEYVKVEFKNVRHQIKLTMVYEFVLMVIFLAVMIVIVLYM